MYYGKEYLDEMIEKMRQHPVSGSFHYNDLALLIAFKQLSTSVSSIQDIERMQGIPKKNGLEVLADVCSGNVDYSFEKAPSIPVITDYLVGKKIMQGSRDKNLEIVDKAIRDLEDNFGIIENSELAEPWCIPRLEATFSYHDGNYIIQAVTNFQRYKTQGVDNQIFFDFSK
ncbi:hypothetical protein K9L97_01035 [Candidatus Woesearchaeota archaeon]|nr:hypothetical protein [Candidatus Woesearchaeota archaeon]